jgi:hypothetical protein
MSDVAVTKQGGAQFVTAYSAWRRLLRMYPASGRVQHQLTQVRGQNAYGAVESDGKAAVQLYHGEGAVRRVY